MQRLMGHASIARTALIGVAYVLAFLGLDVVSQVGRYGVLGVSPWNPSAGLALAFAFVQGRAGWPYMFGAALLDLLIVHPIPSSVLLMVVVGAASAATWIAGGEALHRFGDFDPGLRSVRSVLQLFVVASVEVCRR